MDDLSFEIEVEPFEVTTPVADQFGTVYRSVGEACRMTGQSRGRIDAVLAGRSERAGAYRFRFA